MELTVVSVVSDGRWLSQKGEHGTGATEAISQLNAWANDVHSALA